MLPKKNNLQRLAQYLAEQHKDVLQGTRQAGDELARCIGRGKVEHMLDRRLDLFEMLIHDPTQAFHILSESLGDQRRVEEQVDAALSAIEQGEDALRQLGFRQVRVRHHGEIARIEIAHEELSRAMTLEMAAEFTRIFKALGFSYVTLDLEGFRSGSMNALLPIRSLVEMTK